MESFYQLLQVLCLIDFSKRHGQYVDTWPQSTCHSIPFIILDRYNPRECLHNTVSALMSLNCTVLKWLSAYYVNLTSIKQTKRIGSTPPIQTQIPLHTLFPGPSAATSHTHFLCLRKEYALPYSSPFCRHLPHTQNLSFLFPGSSRLSSVSQHGPLILSLSSCPSSDIMH